MNVDLSLFDHVFIDHQAQHTLFLLHGTGGSKEDLLFFDGLLDHTYNMVGLQGNVSEQGMARFFKRFSAQTFDITNIEDETAKLAGFIHAWSNEHTSVVPDNYAFLGYSNGANMLVAMLLLYPKLMKTTVLLHPLVPLEVPKVLDLSESKIFISVGARDSVISPTQGYTVEQICKEAKAKVLLHEYPGGHSVSEQEIEDITVFLRTEVQT